MIEAGVTIGVFLLFVLSNWGICSLMDGEGKMGEILTFCALALLPMILVEALLIGLTNVMSLNEEVFITWIRLFGQLWTAFLLFQAVRIAHRYSSLRSIAAIGLSVLGVMIILFLALLVVSLFQQVVVFFQSIYTELVFRK